MDIESSSFAVDQSKFVSVVFIVLKLVCIKTVDFTLDISVGFVWVQVASWFKCSAPPRPRTFARANFLFYGVKSQHY